MCAQALIDIGGDAYVVFVRRGDALDDVHEPARHLVAGFKSEAGRDVKICSETRHVTDGYVEFCDRFDERRCEVLRSAGVS